jgi:hypothetical protein
MAKATTSGGLMRKFAFTLWWMRASKLRLPESTEAATTSWSTRSFSTRASRGPEFPMQVVQPYPTTWKPSASRSSCSPVSSR